MLEFYQWASKDWMSFILVTFILTAAIVVIIETIGETWRRK
jgi:hypothetical protein